MGAGKDTLAPRVMRELGYTGVKHMAFADALRAEVNGFIHVIRADDLMAMAILPSDPVLTNIIDMLKKPVKTGVIKDAHDRSNTMRTVLQLWGEHQREDDDSYWCDRFAESYRKNMRQPVMVTDCRYPNELDMIHKLGGYVVRLDASSAARARRLLNRDHHLPDLHAFTHISETAADDYMDFDVRVNTDGLNPEQLTVLIADRLRPLLNDAGNR
ncbi:hypothetical protein DF196_02200 [Bifidobacterium callitrichidarum]|uniref:Dephospho-CoA kinase n=2 Tax=Bifidobacterium callitrichidarum TaxID=2052941 RepID=A0A2U2NC55_9BIFI|nr:hypothetical protein DF196_02200 [Bifidobacterium callitrichidarum]